MAAGARLADSWPVRRLRRLAAYVRRKPYSEVDIETMTMEQRMEYETDRRLRELSKVPKELTITHRRRVITHVLKLIAWQPWRAYALYFLAILALCVLPYQELHHRPRRVDENALLPGQITRYFSAIESNQVQSAGADLDELLQRHPRCATVLDPPCPQLANWIRDSFVNASLDVGTQQFHLNDPYRKGASFLASNIYAINRAPRADGSEAILLTFPIVTHDNKFNKDGITFAVTFAKFVARFTHWAKDIVFLVPAKNTLGTHVFLQAYHGIPSQGGVEMQKIQEQSLSDSTRGRSESDKYNDQYVETTTGSNHEENGNSFEFNPSFSSETSSLLRYSPLRKFSGVIEQALNIELVENGEYTSFSLYMEGLNGQLPNADAVLTVFKILSFEGFPVYLHDTPSMPSDTNMQRYRASTVGLLEYISRQATGIPRFAHALCIPFHIEAVTLRGNFDSSSWPRMKLFQVGRTIESILRSFNNLLERLHHSYWFYFMAGPNNYINMSVYLPPVLFMFVPLIMHAFYLWAYRPNTDPDEYIGQFDKVLIRPNPMLNAMPRKPIPIEGTPFYARPENVIHFSPVFRPLFIPFSTLGLVLAVGLSGILWTPFVNKLLSSSYLSPFILSILGLFIFAFIALIVCPLIQNFLSVDSLVLETSKDEDIIYDPELAQRLLFGSPDAESPDRNLSKLRANASTASLSNLTTDYSDAASITTVSSFGNTDEETKRLLASTRDSSDVDSELYVSEDETTQRGITKNRVVNSATSANLNTAPLSGSTASNRTDSSVSAYPELPSLANVGLANELHAHINRQEGSAGGMTRSTSFLESLANFDPRMPDPPAPIDKIADWVILKCLVCLIHAASMITVAMLNPALAIVIGITSVPAFLLASPLKIRAILLDAYEERQANILQQQQELYELRQQQQYEPDVDQDEFDRLEREVQLRQEEYLEEKRREEAEAAKKRATNELNEEDEESKKDEADADEERDQFPSEISKPKLQIKTKSSNPDGSQSDGSIKSPNRINSPGRQTPGLSIKTSNLTSPPRVSRRRSMAPALSGIYSSPQRPLGRRRLSDASGIMYPSPRRRISVSQPPSSPLSLARELFSFEERDASVQDLASLAMSQIERDASNPHRGSLAENDTFPSYRRGSNFSMYAGGGGQNLRARKTSLSYAPGSRSQSYDGMMRSGLTLGTDDESARKVIAAALKSPDANSKLLSPIKGMNGGNSRESAFQFPLPGSSLRSPSSRSPTRSDGSPMSPGVMVSPGLTNAPITQQQQQTAYFKGKKYLVRVRFDLIRKLSWEFAKVLMLIIANPILLLAFLVTIDKIAAVILPSFIFVVPPLELLFADSSNGAGVADFVPGSGGIVTSATKIVSSGPIELSRCNLLNLGIYGSSSCGIFAQVLSLIVSLSTSFPGIVESWQLFGGWVYPFIMCVYIPLNLAMFIVLWMDPEDGSMAVAETDSDLDSELYDDDDEEDELYDPAATAAILESQQATPHTGVGTPQFRDYFGRNQAYEV